MQTNTFIGSIFIGLRPSTQASSLQEVFDAIQITAKVSNLSGDIIFCEEEKIKNEIATFCTNLLKTLQSRFGLNPGVMIYPFTTGGISNTEGNIINEDEGSVIKQKIKDWAVEYYRYAGFTIHVGQKA